MNAIAFTTFAHRFATTKREERITPEALAVRIEQTSQTDKTGLEPELRLRLGQSEFVAPHRLSSNASVSTQADQLDVGAIGRPRGPGIKTGRDSSRHRHHRGHRIVASGAKQH
jgi:hypothetical protein